MLVAGALTACGAVTDGTRGAGEPTRSATHTATTAPTPARNRAAARQDARALLGEAVVPGGAIRRSHEPSGDRGVLDRPAQVPALADLVDLHRWWRVPSSLASVYRFVKSHTPSGGRLDGWGRRYPRPDAAFVDFEWPPVSGVIQSRDLNIELVRLGAHTTGVRVDAQVVWIVPRPWSERIPGDVREIDVTRERLGRFPRVTVRATAQAVVRELIAAFNRLPIVQPGAVESCPFGIGQPTVIFAFRLKRAGPAVARATYSGACGSVDISIDGRRRTPLADAQPLLLLTERLLDVKLIGLS